MAKRLVFCFDGTWNRLSTDNPTNVVMLAQMVSPISPDGTPQIVYYDEGVGTGAYFARRLYEGMFGKGVLNILREAYRFLIFNYEPGDEIFIFGFSRGAFTARSFAGFIRHAGILDVSSASQIDEAIRIYREAPAGVTGSESLEALEFRARYCKSVCVSEDDHAYRRMTVDQFDPATPILDIRYLGVWDTVRALGVPDAIPGSAYLNERYGFHDAVLTSKVRAARHAVALHERRWTFPPTLFERDKIAELNAKAEGDAGRTFEDWEKPYQQKWFPGVHGAIGGGGQRRGLSDAALHWVLSGARRAGLALRSNAEAKAYSIRPDPFDRIFNDAPGRLKRIQYWFYNRLNIARTGPSEADEIAHCTYRRWYEPKTRNPQEDYPLRNAAFHLAQWRYASPPEWKGGTGESDDILEEYATTDVDTLSRIARDRLGDAARWRELFDLNRDRIEDPDYLPTDIVLRIPRMSDSATPP